MSFDDICCRADIFKSAARASGDNALLYVKLSVTDLILERILYRAVQADKGFLLYIVKDVLQICIYLINGIHIARMERHCDHRPDLA